ncbi:MAG: patatin-like phospholipase family protein [Terrisporobacter sp.]
MYADLVCKGGGVKGIALVGAISCLEEHGYIFKSIAGTSVGAIVASLLAVGYSGKEISNIMLNLDYNCFADKSKLQSIPLVGQFLSLFKTKGIHSGDYIENFLREKFQAKGKTTFRDICNNDECRLKLIATDVTKHTLIILPDDLVKYNINPLDFEIAKAVRMSLSIPIYYNPVILNENENTSYIVDGGLLSNFPIWIFDAEKTPQWPTFGLNLFDNYEIKKNNKNGLLPFLFDIVETSLYTSEDIYFKDSDSVRIINIPTLGINAIDFNISKEEIIDLYNSGYKSAKSFLETWNFQEYIKIFRS